MLRYIPRLATRSTRNIRFFATKTPSSHDLYMEKLQKKATAMGLSSVEELKAKLKDDIAQKKKEFNALDPLKELDEFEQKQAEILKQKKKSLAADRGPIDKSEPQAPYKTLSSFVDVEKVVELPEKELKFIWNARFLNKEGAMHATLNATQFANIYANAFKNPNFILPLPRDGQGYEMHFVQWAFVGPYTTHCMLTSLAEYKLHNEYAKPHTTLMFHQELVDETGLVLMNGQLEKDSLMTLDEAQLLVLNVQRFYGGLTESLGSARKLALLKAFTSGSEDFDMDKLIEEAASFD
ncbi:CIC11C00000002695 [Sungouiella intermedia]|uniref:CIC11C00000002695 n=1 Tax=Sungouiella intermedia TaxID=45354 RepID=A0A1L0BYH9_9ASCO|nr:CIC11C00000002695 [[Candida] intermedia]